MMMETHISVLMIALLTLQMKLLKCKINSISQHQLNLLYAAACGIGNTSYNHILSKVHGECDMGDIDINKWTDGDHSLHRLMMCSNSVYWCYHMDHKLNTICAKVCLKAKDWCHAFIKREYNGGN